MDSSTGNKGQSIVRKGKKKQVKDELDRQKQAEKKRRRLEKALATSAAIISQLEKKKKEKKEEQQRLDEEGASIAEAVALHVLLGEDSDDSCKTVVNKDEDLNTWNCAGNFDLFVEGRGGSPGFRGQKSERLSLEGIGWFSNAYRSGCKWSGFGGYNEGSFASGRYSDDFGTSYFEKSGWGSTGISAGLIAAQAISSLQIAEDVNEETIALDGILQG